MTLCKRSSLEMEEVINRWKFVSYCVSLSLSLIYVSSFRGVLVCVCAVNQIVIA